MALDIAQLKIKLKDLVSSPMKKINQTIDKQRDKWKKNEHQAEKSSRKIKNSLRSVSSASRLLSAKGGLSSFSNAARLGASSSSLLAGGAILAGVGVYKLGSALIQSSKELENNKRLAANIFAGTPQQINKVTASATALSKTFKTDYTQTLQAADQISRDFGINTQDSFKLIERSLLTSSDPSKLLGQIQTATNSLKGLGLSASQQIALTAQAAQLGVGDQLPAFVNSFAASLPKLSGEVKSILDNSFGQGFTTGLKDDIKNGRKTVVDGIKSISKATAGLSLSKRANIARQVFGDDSQEALRLLSKVGGFENGLDAINQKGGTFSRSLSKQLQLEKDIAAQQLKMSESWSAIGDKLKVAGLNAKLYLYKGLNAVAGAASRVSSALSNAFNSVKNKAIELRQQAIDNNPAIKQGRILFKEFQEAQQAGKGADFAKNLEGRINATGLGSVLNAKQLLQKFQQGNNFLTGIKKLQGFGAADGVDGLGTVDNLNSKEFGFDEPTKNGLNAGIDSIVGGGQQVKNINVTIEKMTGIETLVSSVQEAIPDMEKGLLDSLMRVLRGAEINISR